ncbi:hypothetical protein C8Q73DRAFT_789883 [Cubamyces lactineus]|nr:hypothetical protein C8Q73DRAFT_789883 [Cubamyces lactineus]
MSSSESVESAEIADRSFLFLANVALFAEATLIFYEYGITINNEVRLIWRRKVTGASVLFVLNRYIMIMDNIITLASFPAMSNRNSHLNVPIRCYALAWIDVVLNLLPYFVWNAFSTMRVYAISGRDWRIAALVCILMLGPIISNIYNIPFEFPVNMPPPYGCSFDNSVSLATHAIVPLMAGDAIVILVTWWKTYKLKKAADEARITISLVDLLLRDGSVYFATMLVVNSLHIMMNYVVKISFLGDVADVITSILISRFIMNLRDIDGKDTGEVSRSTRTELGGPGSWHATPERSEGGGRGRGTLVFAPGSNYFVESMGGALEHSMWARSSDDCGDESREDATLEREPYLDVERAGGGGEGEKTPAEAASSTVLG